MRMRRSGTRSAAGLTYIEALTVTAVVVILAAVAIPYARWTARRVKEADLRRNLAILRQAIDQYHRDSVEGSLDTSRLDMITTLSGPPPARHYPPDLQTLVDGVPITGGAGLPGEEQAKKRIYLRRLPRDPFVPEGDECDEAGWNLRSYQDEPDTPSWGRENVYDVRSCSELMALDGVTYYKDW